MAATCIQRPVDYLKNLGDRQWLISANSHQLQPLVAELASELAQLSASPTPLKIIIAEREPISFLASFIAACSANCQVFLCNPDWGTQEWQQVLHLVQPDVVWGMGHGAWGMGHGAWGMGHRAWDIGHGAWEQDTSLSPPSSPSPHHPISSPPPSPHHPIPSSPLIMIPTGGSSGKIKFAIHTWETLMASVQGLREYFQLSQVNSFCVLPLYHVSGLMQFMRSFTTGGQLVISSLQALESGQIPHINPTDFFISLVPTQLQRLLQNPQLTAWLTQFTTVLLGGAPAWTELLDTARCQRIRLAPTYGMTETASQIATLKPDDFLNGQVGVGQILPHAQVKICHAQGGVLGANQPGNIIIQAQSLTLGYYPEIWQNQADFSVDDLGFLDAQGYLNIVGRDSNKIISGGENIYPLEVESAIRATQLVTDVCVIGVPDQHWGQVVTAIYVPLNSHTVSGDIQALLKEQLSKFKIPKHWLAVDSLPYNSQGKINRQKLQQIAQGFLQE